MDRKKILWTIFKAYREIIEELDVGNDSFRPKRGDVETFIPLNMRASNSYLDRNVVFYLVDRYVGLNEPGVDRNKLSLDELLQFLFRTCLRLPDSEKWSTPTFQVSGCGACWSGGWIILYNN